MAPYEHPFRHCLAEAWRSQTELRRATVAVAVLWAGSLIGVALGVTLLGLLAGTGAMFATIIGVLWVVAIARVTYRVTRAWRQPSELGAARAQRPHAAERDGAIPHDEFAVSVEDDGHLVTWRFRPLAFMQAPGDDWNSSTLPPGSKLSPCLLIRAGL